MDAEGGDVRRVTEIWGEYPAWSPDGRAARVRLVSRAAPARPAIRTTTSSSSSADGTGLRRLTAEPGLRHVPDVVAGRLARLRSSRPGRTPAGFEPPPRDLERTADFDVFVVPAGGGEAQNVTRDPVRLQKFPDLSPDGRWLAVDEEGSVAFAAADGSGMRRVAGLTGGFPAWAPAG